MYCVLCPYALLNSDKPSSKGNIYKHAAHKHGNNIT